MAASAAADRSAVASPISTMKIGISGSAISTITADCQVVERDHGHGGGREDAGQEQRGQIAW